jgi:hypothetical protein
MPSEMRRPGPIAIDGFSAALDLRLRAAVKQTRHQTLPSRLLGLLRSVRRVLQPLMQSGAIVLTSLAIIVAIGVAPGTLQRPIATANAPVDAPSSSSYFVLEGHDFLSRLPAEEFLASEGVQIADNQDTPLPAME